MTAAPAGSMRDDLRASAARLGGVLGVGALCGALVGGVGGRLAMLVLRLTSGANVVGLESDDGFTIGHVTASTIFLVLLTTFLGAAGALVYYGVRRWLPARGRPLQMAVLCGLLAGSVIVDPDGVDFVLLTPHWLAVALFVALPAAYAALTARSVEARLRATSTPTGRAGWLGLAPLALLAVAGPVGLLLVILLLGGFVALRRYPIDPTPWPATIGIVRGALVIVALVSATSLANDVADII